MPPAYQTPLRRSSQYNLRRSLALKEDTHAKMLAKALAEAQFERDSYHRTIANLSTDVTNKHAHIVRVQHIVNVCPYIFYLQ